MKAKEYQLVVSKDLYDFNQLVTEALKEGWELYGETIVNSNACKDHDGDEQVFTVYNQAMIHV